MKDWPKFKYGDVLVSKHGGAEVVVLCDGAGYSGQTWYYAAITKTSANFGGHMLLFGSFSGGWTKR